MLSFLGKETTLPTNKDVFDHMLRVRTCHCVIGSKLPAPHISSPHFITTTRAHVCMQYKADEQQVFTVIMRAVTASSRTCATRSAILRSDDARARRSSPLAT